MCGVMSWCLLPLAEICVGVCSWSFYCHETRPRRGVNNNAEISHNQILVVKRKMVMH